jgi:hypothetical protein
VGVAGVLGRSVDKFHEWAVSSSPVFKLNIMDTGTDGHRFLEEHLPEPIFSGREDLFDRGKLQAAVQAAVGAVELKMSEIWPKLSQDPFYKNRIEKIAEKESGVEGFTTGFLYRVAAEYLVQEKIFHELKSFYELEDSAFFERMDENGVIALTSSNSVVVVAPLDGGTRNVEYVRIPSREASWPDPVSYSNVALDTDVVPGQRLKAAHLLNTSKVRALAIIPWGKSQEVAELCAHFDDALSSVRDMGGPVEDEDVGEERED